MTKALSFIGVLVLCGWNGFGQTNGLSNEANLFSPLELKVETPATEATQPAKAPEILPAPTLFSKGPDLAPTVATTAADLGFTLTLEREVSPFDLALIRRLQEGGFLTRPEPRPSLLTHPVDAIFEPEVLRLGKRSVSCSVITAVKRRNPLCLLNPEFFRLSW